MRVNTICLSAGHYRVEKGSEQYLFYELEERLQRPSIHGGIVGLGVHLLSRLQDNRHAEALRSWIAPVYAINLPIWRSGGITCMLH